jgi:hypothetical protein
MQVEYVEPVSEKIRLLLVLVQSKKFILNGLGQNLMGLLMIQPLLLHVLYIQSGQVILLRVGELLKCP